MSVQPTNLEPAALPEAEPEPSEAPADPVAVPSPSDSATSRDQVLSALTAQAPAEADDDVLHKHLAFFDVDGTGVLTVPGVAKAMEELLGLPSAVAIPAAAATLAALPTNRVDELETVMRHNDTGSFTKDGKFDEAGFDEWFAKTDTSGKGSLSQLDLLRASVEMSKTLRDFTLSVRELQPLYLVLKHQGEVGPDGRVSKEALRDFFSGALFDRIAARRAAGG
jgi:hypothetical protein